MHCMHLRGYFAGGENTHTLRLTSKLVDLRVGKAPADSMSKRSSIHFSPRSIRAMHRDASLLWRVIEVVITRRS